ncbi:MAG TPA: beta-propeller fold lactonase family protein, partial [Leptospiraceae bacterium]|nr:beta-propeller fold lactonase family protein [Leptospiraceae bacterium]
GIAGGTFTVLTGPQIPAFDSFGRYAYISTNSVPRVNLLNILSDGSLSNIAAAITPGASPLQGSIDPLNHALYVPNNGAGTISMYTIGSDGSLNSLGTVSPGGAPSTLTIDPTGRFLYTRTGTANIWMYSIDQTTYALAPIGGGTIASGTNPRMLSIHPSGRFAYAPDQSTATLYMYSIDQTTGALTALSGTSRATGGTATAGCAFDAPGSYLYQADGGGSTISQYYVDSSSGQLWSQGVLTAAATPRGPLAMANYNTY